MTPRVDVPVIVFSIETISVSAYSLRSKSLFLIAFVDHIRYIPYLLQTKQGLRP